ncbi:MAG: phosphate-starvation-inducible PsiE family protein [Methylotenera sp.]|uniref:phosphate-starvation-inducible protein PsiE n=1 Tax=Methylotenera sp. TaxID=2051956 RepID=UPI0017A5566B|nr:phosphate-starvation-inducible PsiE family protein [Methylotenera sp.]NOU24617.1 phosphate-starvation-inducible PsiE family protein [Methylotenera sp.]
MTPNRFSRLMQRGLGIVEQAVLITIALATIFAVLQAILHIWQAQAITVGDLLLLFLYLEVMSMLNHYLGSGNLPVRYPLYIGIIALARYLVLEVAEIDAWQMLALSGSIFLIAIAILVIRYGHVRFPYIDCPTQQSK